MLPRLDCSYVKATSDEAARQLTAAAPDLEHPITTADSRDLTCLIDELVGIGGTTVVIFSRHLVEDPAVAPCRSRFHHSLNVEDVPDRMARAGGLGAGSASPRRVPVVQGQLVPGAISGFDHNVWSS